MDAQGTRPRPTPEDADGRSHGAPREGAADVAVRRVLRAPSGRADQAGAHRLFSVSILLSAGRCLLTYLILPIAVPLVGTSVTTDAAIGLPLSVVAIIFDIRAVRRFWLADHPWRRQMTLIYLVVMALVIGLAVRDLVNL